MNYSIKNFTSLIFLLTCITLELHAQKINDPAGSYLKTSLNAYSFNTPLLKEGTMNLDELLEFCAATDLDAVDITAYYFPGYPKVPSDEYLYHIKRKSFLLGIEISGTGVRNNFCSPDNKVRQEGIQLVKDWVIAAKKLGAPVVRVFSGQSDITGYTREQVTDWMVKDLKECAAFGKQHGVMIGLQNHHDFLMTADHIIDVIEKVDSEWLGLILDTGSYWEGDSYEQIERTIKYAINWQVKDLTYMNGKSEKLDLDRLFTMIKKSGYRGYVPIETLGDGDSYVKVDKFLKEVKASIVRVYGK